MKTITEAGFPSLAFFQMVAQIKPSADHVLVSLGGEEGRMEWRPYGGGGGGLEATITFDWGAISVTSTYLQGETTSLFYFDNEGGGATNSVLSSDFECTGQMWEFTTGTLSVKIFTGIAAGQPLGYAVIYSRYVAAYNSATNDYNLSLTQSLLLDETNYDIVDGNNTTGDFDYSRISSNQTFQRKLYVNFVETLSNNISISPSQLGTDDAILGDVDYHFLGYRYAEVDITAAEILTIGTVPVILLPAPAAGTYYYILKVLQEFTTNTTPYVMTAGDKFYLGLASQQYATMAADVQLQSGTDSVYQWSGLHGGLVDTVAGELAGYPSPLPSALSLAMTNNPLVAGDGTLKMKIWYQIVTFG